MLLGAALEVGAGGHGGHSLHRNLDVLLQVFCVLVLERKILRQLRILPLQDQILLRKVRRVHLLEQILIIEVPHVQLVETALHFVHFGKQCFDLQVLLLDDSPHARLFAILVVSSRHHLGNDLVLLLYYVFERVNLLLPLLNGAMRLDEGDLHLLELSAQVAHLRRLVQLLLALHVLLDLI